MAPVALSALGFLVMSTWLGQVAFTASLVPVKREYTAEDCFKVSAAAFGTVLATRGRVDLVWAWHLFRYYRGAYSGKE